MSGVLGRLRASDLARVAIDREAMRRIGPAIVSADLPVGVPRDQLTVPVSPDGRVVDTVLFEDPADSNRFYYLPRYRLRIDAASGRYEITTKLVEGQWRMTFGLEGFPADEIKATGEDAEILPHELTVSVTSGSGLARDYPVAEFDHGGTELRPEVVLVLTLAERDALLRAFTQDEERARIEVRRSVTVAVPAAQPSPWPDMMVALRPDLLGTPVILPDLVIADIVQSFPIPLRHVEPVPDRPEPDPRLVDELRGGAEVVDRGAVMVDHGAVVVDHGADIVDGGLQVLDQGASGGLRQEVVVDRAFARSAVVTDAGVTRLSFRSPKAPGILRRADLNNVGRAEAIRRGGVFDNSGIVLRPGDGGIIWNPFPRPEPDPTPDPEPAPVQRYSVVASTHVDLVLLRFDVDAHPYLFPSGQPASGGGGFATLVVPWPAQGPSSHKYVYFHDQAAGNVFYYLPDAFLVGLRDEPPYGPELSFTVGRTTEAEGGAERAVALINVHLVPQTSPARLYDAAQELADHVVAGSGEPELRPAVHPATCRLELPGAAITTSAPPDLVNGWWVGETFGFDDLRDVYAVLTTGGAASAMLRGRVDVDVMGEVHQVPVELRLDRLSGPALSWTEEQLFDARRSVTVTLRNVGDVTLSVPPLRGWVDRGGSRVPADVAGDLPVQLLPDATVELELKPEHRPSGPGDSRGTLDLTTVRAVVDPEHAVEQTLDRRVARLPRVVTLLTTEGGLGATGDQERDLQLIGLQFSGVSGAVTLDRATLQRDVAVPVPLVDWLLDRGSGAFEYKQTLVHVSGGSQSDVEWRSVDTSLLVLPQPVIPPVA